MRVASKLCGRADMGLARLGAEELLTDCCHAEFILGFIWHRGVCPCVDSVCRYIHKSLGALRCVIGPYKALKGLIRPFKGNLRGYFKAFLKAILDNF